MNHEYYIYYFAAVNLIAFVMFAWDKMRAAQHQRRTSEKALFGIALIGGSLGAWAGMYVFRHKTKHWYFQLGIPLILVLQILLVLGIHFF